MTRVKGVKDMEKVKLCRYYNEEKGTCGSAERRLGDMRYIMGKSMLPVVYCDYDKNHDKQVCCPYNR